jgi:isocitrate dehydrogenase
MAIIFAWSGCLRKRGELDDNPNLVNFANMLEESAVETIESGIMTGDLIGVAEENMSNTKVDTEGFIDAITGRLKKKLSSKPPLKAVVVY